MPELHGDPRGEAHHARPRAPAVRDAARRAELRLARTSTSRRRWTCAWPARAARATARSTSTWRRTRPSSCRTTTRGGCAAPAYAMGLIHRWARLASHRAGLVNASSQAPLAAAAAEALGGLAPGAAAFPRSRPRLSRPGLARGGRRANPDGPRVLLWPDTFNDHFHPGHGAVPPPRCWRRAGTGRGPAAASCAAGGRSTTSGCSTARSGCCANDPARAARRDRRRHAGGRPGAECVSVFRDELVDLMPDDQDARRLKQADLLLRRVPDRAAPPAARCRGWAAGGRPRPLPPQGGHAAWTTSAAARGDWAGLRGPADGLLRHGRLVRVRARREIPRVAGDRRADVLPRCGRSTMTRCWSPTASAAANRSATARRAARCTSPRWPGGPSNVGQRRLRRRPASRGPDPALVGPARLDPRRPAAAAGLALAGLIAGPALRGARARGVRRAGRALSSGWVRGVLGGGLLAGAALAALAVSASRTRRER